MHLDTKPSPVHHFIFLVFVWVVHPGVKADSLEPLRNTPVTAAATTASTAISFVDLDRPTPIHANDPVRLTAATSILTRIDGARGTASPTKVGHETHIGTSSTESTQAPLTLTRSGPLEWQQGIDTGASPALPAHAEPDGNGTSKWGIVPSDQTLNAVVSRWATAAGWQLVWELPVDYMVESQSTITGTFENAVETVARSMQSVEVPMKAIFYRKNKVVRIVAKGVQ